jgi:hypothetical protein
MTARDGVHFYAPCNSFCEVEHLHCAQRSLCTHKTRAHVHKHVTTVDNPRYVPVIQGMMREAYETDPNGGAVDADGFVEVAEGWAFAAAVLPLIAECNSANASTIRTNMDTLSQSASERNSSTDGYLAVVRAVESV